jgi:hypothetical protein
MKGSPISRARRRFSFFRFGVGWWKSRTITAEPFLHCLQESPGSQCADVDTYEYIPVGNLAHIHRNELVHRNGYCYHTPHSAWNNLYFHLLLAAILAPHGFFWRLPPDSGAQELHHTCRSIEPFMRSVFKSYACIWMSRHVTRFEVRLHFHRQWSKSQSHVRVRVRWHPSLQPASHVVGFVTMVTSVLQLFSSFGYGCWLCGGIINKV